MERVKTPWVGFLDVAHSHALAWALRRPKTSRLELGGPEVVGRQHRVVEVFKRMARPSRSHGCRLRHCKANWRRPTQCSNRLLR